MESVPENRAITEQTFFITASLKDRKPLFAKSNSAKVVLDSLQFFRQGKEIELYGYVIMPDHIHAVFKVVPPCTISDIVRRLKTYVAHRLGYGPIWEKGCWTEVLTSLSLLQQKLNYIHDNPIRAGLVLEPSEYEWSSAREYYVNETFQSIDSYME